MYHKKEKIFKIVKLSLVVLALLNLAVLFFFQYELPDVFHSDKSKKESAGDTNNQSEAVAFSFQFTPETLSYDGQETLDLLEGVSLTSADGQPSDAEIFAHIKTGASLSEKIIEYSADIAGERVTASRTLKLDNYKGPSIVLPEALPAINEEDLDALLTHMPADGSFYADDGYGNQITDAIVFKYSRDDSNIQTAHYIFTVTNLFNDSSSVEADFSINISKPVIILTESSITIPLNSSFNSLEYIKNAVDVDGSSLFHSIQISGEVNTSVAGTYTLEYIAASPSGNISLPKQLTVTVE